jgi:hypothetical protein
MALVAKYDPLREHLLRQRADSFTMTFEEVAAVVPGGLPASAYRYPAWWANEASGSHTHARAWLDAGFRTRALSLTARRVTFAR